MSNTKAAGTLDRKYVYAGAVAANQDIRAAARSSGVFLYDVAAKLGVAESTLTRKLRRELPDSQKEHIKTIISEIALSRSENTKA